MGAIAGETAVADVGIPAADAAVPVAVETPGVPVATAAVVVIPAAATGPTVTTDVVIPMVSALVMRLVSAMDSGPVIPAIAAELRMSV